MPEDFAGLTSVMLRAIALALRARLRLSRSASAAARSLNKRWLRVFLLMPHPPLLFKEGSVALDFNSFTN
jgi:hypothetical protein